ncbi:MAG: hypothetical protein LBQ42_05420 [Synergistaceae bacterium]|jgi:curli biogenesis system outer membrane secretion channel CsgG/TolA-binding protein|nr:hypothetical protein [Synergistaceae bacterium]
MKQRERIFKAFLFCALLASFAGIAEAADKIRLGVLEFESKAAGVSNQQAQIITDIFTRTLTSSKSIAVYERLQLQKIGEEQHLNMSGLVDPSTAVEIGRLAGLQYILLGAVTELSEKASGGAIPLFGIGGAIGIGTHEAKATIDMRVIDVTTSEIVLSLSESGSSLESATAFTIAGITGVEAEFGGLKARAIAVAASRLGHEIREELGGEYSYVVSVSGSDYVINLGSTMGAKEGSLYLVYAEGKPIRDIDGTLIGKDKIPLAVLKVRDVESGHSVCSVASPSKGTLVRRGDKIEPIAASKSKGMKFATTRPAASSGTFDQVFGEAGSNAPDTQTLPEEPVVAETPITTPSRPTESASANTPEQRPIAGFDPNTSTEAKVIQTYPIASGEANILGIKHRNAYNKYKSNRFRDAYAEFSEAAESYGGNYLSAYWAGRSAQGLKKQDDARTWFERALAINPNYQPAQEALGKIK